MGQEFLSHAPMIPWGSSLGYELVGEEALAPWDYVGKVPPTSKK